MVSRRALTATTVPLTSTTTMPSGNRWANWAACAKKSSLLTVAIVEHRSRVSGCHPADPIHQSISANLLEDVSGRSRRDRGAAHLVIVERCQHQNPGGGKAGPDLTTGLDARRAVHAHVHDDEVGRRLADTGQGRSGVGRLSNDVKVLLGLEEAMDSSADHGVVITDQDADPDG